MPSINYSKKLTPIIPKDPVANIVNDPEFANKQVQRLETEQAKYAKNALSRAVHRRKLQDIDKKLDFARSLAAQSASTDDELEDAGPEL